MVSSRIRVALAVLIAMILTVPAPMTAKAAATVTARADNVVVRISLSPRSPNILTVGQQVTISFSYNTTVLGGVLITPVPFSGTSPTPSATNCSSPIYPVGQGTGTCTFSIGAGGLMISSIRFQMWDAGHTTKLFQALLPVHYLVVQQASMVSSLVIRPGSPNVILPGEHVSVQFSYQTDQPAGVVVLAVPFTGTMPTPNYKACTGIVLPTGSGTGSCAFSIGAAGVNVTSIRLQAWNATKTTQVFQAFVPVFYHVRSNPSMVSHMSMAPTTPNVMRLGANVAVHFSYQTDQAAGVIVVVTPFTGTSPTPNATVCSSGLLPTGTGLGACSFSISSGAALVNKLRFQVWDSTQSTLLWATMLRVNYQFR